MRSEGDFCVCVCVCVCVLLPVKLHFISGASLSPDSAIMYSVGNEGQKFSHILQRLSASSLGWPYIWLVIFPAENMHAHCAYSFSPKFTMRCSCRNYHKLSIHYSFTMIIFG